MSIAKTFTVTVVSTGSGNKYVIDGVQQDTIMIGAGLTYKFDQSDSSNGNHPLRFSTTSNGTHSGGVEYTTGVTTNGVPGNAGAYTQIEVQNGAPSTLYYYCTQHSGMGGQANTDGWGRSYWGQMDWGDSNVVQNGWGRNTWNDGAWGIVGSVLLEGQGATVSLGDITVQQRPGWGTLDWGENGWGSVEEGIEVLTGQQADSAVGSITPVDAVGLTGQAATTSVGGFTFILSPTITPTGQVATVSEGQLSLNNGADHTQGLATLVATSAVGSIAPADVIGLTGQQINSQVGNLIEDTAIFINPTGVQATSAVGSIVLDGMALGITGVQATSAVGSISPSNVMGLTGQEAVSSVGDIIVLGYQDVNIVGNTNYSDVDVVGNTSYTDVTHVAQENKIMASTFTDLGLELMATGENAGTWGTKTNANLSLVEQLTGGVNSQAVTDSGTPTALTIANGALTGTAQHRIIELTGTISGNRIVTFPLLTENFYIIKNGTSGSHTVQLKAVSGSGATVTFATGDKGYKLIYLDGVATNTGVFEAPLGEANEVTLNGVETLTNKTLTSPKIGTAILDTGGNELIKLTATGSAVNELTLANAATGNKPTLTASGGDTNISVAILPKGSGQVVIDNLTFPAADGSANQILTTNGSGVLSFVDNSGGTDWQAVKTGTYTAVAGQGIFANTTSGAWTLTLPSSPSIGDEVSVIDYAGTFDTNNLTIGRNSQKIQGAAADLTVATERAGFTLAFTDGTQGWLLKNN